MLKLFLICVCISQTYVVSGRNNVCKRFEDYVTIVNNKNCYYNPDVDSSLSQIARRYGFTFEEYKVKTEDGYILGIFRISYANNTSRRQPVVLQHGLISSGATWMLLGEKSLAFFLARNGYDVWLPNFRGSAYSNGHENPYITEKEYWNFSFHEIGYYDIAAYLDFISQSTGNNKDIVYVGHSLGTTTSFVYSSLRKKDAEKNLKQIIALAPIAYLRNIQGVLPIVAQFLSFIKGSFEKLRIYALGQYIDLQRFLSKLTCNVYPVICELLMALVTGLAEKQLKPEIVPMVTKYLPQGVATKNLYHYSQIILNHGRFQFYDYGALSNMRLYNSTVPPEYDVEAISIPVHLFLGKKDFLGASEGVNYLYKKLNCSKTLHEFEMAHNDFFFGANVESFYTTLLEVIRNRS